MNLSNEGTRPRTLLAETTHDISVEPEHPFEFIRSEKPKHESPFSGYNDALNALAQAAGPHARILEVGGGRSPLGPGLGINHDRLTVNDVSQEELDYLPESATTALFDVSQPAQIPVDHLGIYDLVYSRSVLEHVSSVEGALRSTYSLLQPGGRALHFFPTLFSTPFVANKLLPFEATKPLVKALVGDKYERFPAHYAGAWVTKNNIQRWKNIGYSRVEPIQFFGHGYYRKIPPVHKLAQAFNRHAEARNIQAMGSFVYLCLEK